MATHLEQDWPPAAPLGSDPRGPGPAGLRLDDGGRTGPAGSDPDLRPPRDLAAEFDGRLAASFRGVEVPPERGGPEPGTEPLLAGDEIWTQLTSNYGRVMPVDWMRSRTRSLHMASFDLEEKARAGPGAADQSDDEELREQLDMHSIIVSSVTDEPLFTAEQVIEELEEMMEDDVEEPCPSQTDLSGLALEVQHLTFSPDFQDRVKTLSVAQLNERLQETEAAVRSFSEELVQQLALRDELDFEKEVKNSFISALIDVQNRQKEHRETVKKKRKMKGGGSAERTHGSRFSMEGFSSVIQNSFRHSFGNTCPERQYLTTVIPYERTGRPPPVQDLQILTNILHAMRDDSDKVPGLLTDYILKVLCPT